MTAGIHTQVDASGGRAARRRGRSSAVDTYAGSLFEEVWRTLAETPYTSLPIKRVTALSALEFVRENIYRSARRTLVRRDDLLPEFDKLVHPVGICLRGTWTITERTPYSGYFRQGSRGLLIARASDGLGEHRPGRLRFLGLAGKLYPTTDPGHDDGDAEGTA